MSQEQTLIDRGAEICCGDLIFKGKTLGRYRNGQFQITEDGLAELEVVDVAVVEVPAPKRKAKADPAPEPAAE